MKLTFTLLCIVVFSLWGCTGPAGPGGPDGPFQYLVLDARVLDGTGNSWYRADVGIRDGRIAAIGSLAGMEAEQTLDAAGRLLTPGFVDVHTHVESEGRFGIDDNARADNFLLDGVTTVVTGNCGTSMIDLDSWFGKLEELGLGINVSSLIGHNSVRREVMGLADRAADENDMQEMRSLVDQAMEAGAVGFSTGLLYIPGTYGDTEEVVGLAEVAARYGGVYASHIRNQGPQLQESILEAAEIGRRNNMPVQISHLKVKGKNRWGTIGETLDLIQGLRDEDLEITVDAYPYPRASSNLGIYLPSWALADGQEAIEERLNDPETREKIIQGMIELLEVQGFSDYSFATVASYAADPSLEGKTISEINLMRDRQATLVDERETILEMIAAGGASMVYHYMSQDDVDTIYRYSSAAVASDGGVRKPGLGKPHPRSYGTNARVFADYVRGRPVLTMEEAVRRMTSLPAQVFGFKDRGLIREGAQADLVLFDPAKVQDRATFPEPHQYSEGFDYVWVNGGLAVEEGELTDQRSGRIVRRQ